MKHFRYLSYVIRHKWFVLVAGWLMGARPWSTPRLFWRLFIHDWTKFLPSEWFPYVEYFYGTTQDETDFNRAWGLHQMRNDHHWQNWLTVEDEGKLIVLDMDRLALFEMVADWMGAGRAIHGKWEVVEWYLKARDKMYLHPATRENVELILECLEGQPIRENPDLAGERVKPIFIGGEA